jgi:hypothetical protein
MDHQTPTVKEPTPDTHVPPKKRPDLGSKPDLKNPSIPETERSVDSPMPDMEPPGIDDGEDSHIGATEDQVSDTPAPSGNTFKDEPRQG